MPEISKMMRDIEETFPEVDGRLNNFREKLEKANDDQAPNFNAKQENLLGFAEDLAETVKLLDKEFSGNLPHAIKEALESMHSISEAPATGPVEPLAPRPSEAPATAPSGGMGGMG